MVQQEFCQTCKQKNDCRKVYRELGNVEGPPIAAKVMLAFLLPLLVFIMSLGAFERILTGSINESNVLTAVSLLLALVVTFTCIVLIRMIRRGCRQGG